MTVKQLRKALKKFDPNEPVVIRARQGYVCIDRVQQFSTSSESPAIITASPIHILSESGSI